MTREQLDAIRARVEAATPGPWLTDSCLDVYTEQVREIDPDIGIELYKTVYSHHTAGPEGTQPWHDTHFMAHAREDVPALLAEVERLRDAHAMVVQVSGELCEKCGWAMKFPGEKCRCELLAEVERLTGERDEAFRSREEARAYRDISEQALREESERHAATRSRVQAALGVLWERGRIARGMRAATAGTALADAVTEVFDRLDRARGEVKRLTADPLPAAAWVREVERAAFQRGVAAMREAAACAVRDRWTEAPERVVRALPDPEDKS